jgi:uroporphyrinogen decarboxylase
MTSQERVSAAIGYKKPDCVPVQYYYTPVGYYEHGDKLNDLYRELPGDFQPFKCFAPPVLPASDFDTEGKYHSFKRDDWGTLWEFRIFGIAGIPFEYPLADERKIETYTAPTPPAPTTPPTPPAPSAPDTTAEARKAPARTDSYYHLAGCGSLFERMIEVRPEADVLCDLISDEPWIHRLADIILEYDSALVKKAVASGADGIAFGDDYGTERGLLMSPELWRSFIFPRLKKIFQPARDAGMAIHFHSCGYIRDLLPDFAELGVTSIWPQLPAYNMEDLAKRCRELGLAVAVHTDRARTMTSGTPAEVRELVLREYETFKLADGGGWFYIEADNGFPYANIEALVRTIKDLREGG